MDSTTSATQAINKSEQLLQQLSDPLPTDSSALSELVIESREQLMQCTNQLKSLDSQLSSIQTSYSHLLNKSSKWEDELGSLKAKIPILEREIRSERTKREEEENRVKDLRLTSEESRRAIMRLQVEQNDSRIKAAKEKENHRRSLGPGAMAGWNAASSSSLLTEEAAAEARALKKSKRASLAFGPNAGMAGGGSSTRSSLIGNPPHSNTHRRSASGSGSNPRGSMIYNNDSGSESEQQQVGGGGTIGRSTTLRGLRLSGAPSSSSEIPINNQNHAQDQSSRRSSMASSSSAISPRSNNSDLPLESHSIGMVGSSDPIALTEAALNRSTSLSSRLRTAGGGATGGGPRRSQSNGEVLDGLPSGSGGGLSVPGSNSTLGILSGVGNNGRLSASPTPSQSAMSSMGSPIMEESPSHEQFATMSSSDMDSAIDDEALNTATVSNFNNLSSSTNSNSNSNSNYSTLRSQAILKSKEAEIERLKLEMKGLRKNLEESNESRLASETCLKILREFISSHDNDDGEGKAVLGRVEEKLELESGQAGESSTGIQLLKGMKLPPLPTDKELDEDLERKKGDSNLATSNGNGNGNGGWSIKLPTFGKRSESEDNVANETITNNIQSPTPSSSDKRTSISTPIVTSLGSLWNRNTSSNNQNGLSSLSPTKIKSRDSISASSESSSISQSLNSNNDSTTGSTFGRNLGSWFAKKGSTTPSGGDELSSSPTKEISTSMSNRNSNPNPSPNGLSPIPKPPPSLPARKASSTSQSSISNYGEESPGIMDGNGNGEDEKGLGIGFGKGKEIQINDRARKAMSRTLSVEGDGSFVAPTFD